MAWNPSPEVAVARDVAAKINKNVDRVIILYTTDDGRMGYASYGKTKPLCEQTRKLADAVYERAYKWFEDNG